MLLNPILNASQHVRHVTLHVAIMKSDDTESEVLQILLSSQIPFEFAAVAVAIDLNHQFQPWAIEIHDVFVDGPLPQKGVAQHSASFQLLPEQYFSQGAILSEFPRTLFQFWVVVKYRFHFALGPQVLPEGHPPTPPSKGELLGAAPRNASFKGGIRTLLASLIQLPQQP
jgi:hypothetical protein